MRVGAHVSASGGLGKAIDRAQDIGAEAIQIFASSPRAWAFRPPSEQHAADFRAKAEEADVAPVFIHCSYLVNIGGAPDLVVKSVDLMVKNMVAASHIGAAGVIFHGGSHKGAGFDAIFEQAVGAVRDVLAESPNDTYLVLENSAGMGSHVGSSFAEMGRLISAVDSPNMKVCLDTQHSHAAGYAIADPEGVDAVMSEFDAEIGLDRLVVVHANDSKIKFGSGVDRHENIGEGDIGLDGFETIMAHPAFRDVPFILEVPGFDKKGPDKENVDRLKAVRAAALGTTS